MKRPHPLLLYGAFALVTFIWGTTWGVIRVGLEAGLPPFAGVSLRFAIAAIVLFLLAPFLGVSFEPTRRVRWLWIMNAALNFSLPYAAVHWGEQWVPSGLAAILFATYPLMLALVAHLLLPAERLRWLSTAGILVGFAGVAVIFSDDLVGLQGASIVGVSAIILLAPFTSAITSVVIKRWGKGVHPFSLTAVPMGLTAGFMGAVSLAVEPGPPVWMNQVSLGAVVYLGILGSAVTFTLYFWMLQHMAVTRLSLLTYIIPVVAVVGGTLFLDEHFTRRTLAGSLLVLVGVALASRSRRKASV